MNMQSQDNPQKQEDPGSPIPKREPEPGKPLEDPTEPETLPTDPDINDGEPPACSELI